MSDVIAQQRVDATWRTRLSPDHLAAIEELRQQREAMLANLPSHRGKRLDEALKAARGQPLAIAATLKEEGSNIAEIARDFRERSVNRIIALGCGDSYFIALSIRFAYETLVGLPFDPQQALEYARYNHRLTTPRTGIIALSSSGVVPRTLEALWVGESYGAPTVAVTNRPESPLDKAAHKSIVVRAGRPGPPTQSSTAAMAALFLLAMELAQELRSTPADELAARRQELFSLPDVIARVIEESDEPMRQAAQQLRSAINFNFVGSGPNWGTAHFGYAKIREASWDHSLPWQSEEYDHELTYQLPEGEPVFLIAPSGESHDRNVEIARSVRRDHGFLVSVVTEGDQEITALSNVAIPIPPMSEYFSPLAYVIPLQLFAMHLGIIKAPT
ncbi:MAG TPA: SIS domain-containing protein [Anaerolineae bacterium]|nr:SIS domain-containing protein [Anaerolineae bacterium]